MGEASISPAPMRHAAPPPAPVSVPRQPMMMNSRGRGRGRGGGQMMGGPPVMSPAAQAALRVKAQLRAQNIAPPQMNSVPRGGYVHKRGRPATIPTIDQGMGGFPAGPPGLKRSAPMDPR